MNKNDPISLEERVAVQMEAPRAIQDLRATGLSPEGIVVKMGAYLAGVNPCTASLKIWERGESRPSRHNGAALAYVYREVCGKPFTSGEDK